jgi:hypothetical protein
MSNLNQAAGSVEKNSCTKVLKNWVLGDKDDDNQAKWLKDMRGGLSMTASIIATMSFQLAVNPPGGVVQADVNDYKATIECDDRHGTSLCPGHALLGIVYPGLYRAFLICNTISFIASLSVCLLLVSGLSLKRGFQIWVLCIGMGITITTLGLTYLFAMTLVTPDNILNTLDSVFGIVIFSWIGLLLVIASILLIRLLYKLK